MSPICLLIHSILLTLSCCFSAANANEKIYNVVVLGNTGVGKSSFLNMLAGREDAFKVGDGAMSETALTTAQVHAFLGHGDRVKLNLIDTQGLSDSGGDAKDMQHIKNIVESIKSQEHVDLFIVCFDGPSPRFSSYAQSTVTLFNQIFPDFLQHAVLVFNKWQLPEVARMHALRNEYQAIFRNEYHVESIPSYFIDSNFNRAMLRDNEDGSQSVRHLHAAIQQRTLTQVDALYAHLVCKATTCDVRSIEAKETERERLRQEAERARQELHWQVEEERQRQMLEQIKLQQQLIEQRVAEAVKMMQAQARADEVRRRHQRPIIEVVFRSIFG